jgi:hypothetical protein
LIEKYLTKNNLYGMIVINCLTDEHEKTLLIKHCLKYFTLMTATTIESAEDMNEFVSKNGTLLSVIRVYSENKESMEKLKGGTRVTPPEGKKSQMDILTGKLANLSHDKLQQMIANLGGDGSVNTKSTDHKGTIARRPNKIDASVVQAHMASGSVTEGGKTYYPINRTVLCMLLLKTVSSKERWRLLKVSGLLLMVSRLLMRLLKTQVLSLMLISRVRISVSAVRVLDTSIRGV